MSTLTAVTPEQYLAAERKAEFKSEYIDGEVLPMPGASANHVAIASVASADLVHQLWDRECTVFHSDLRVNAKTNGSYCYPDVVVVRGKPEWLDADQDTLLNPTVIIEVLSPSTEAKDRGSKFAAYQGIASLQEYLLLGSQRISAELYSKLADGSWRYTATQGSDATLELESIAWKLSTARLYKRVDFGH